MYEQSHSLAGFVWQIACATGYSLEYIYEMDYQMLILMMSDAPRYVKKRVGSEMTDDEEINQMASYYAGEKYYQSEL